MRQKTFITSKQTAPQTLKSSNKFIPAECIYADMFYPHNAPYKKQFRTFYGFVLLLLSDILMSYFLRSGFLFIRTY